METPMLDFGTCPCRPDAAYERRFVDIRFPQSDGAIQLRSVPQGACPYCFSRVYKAEVLERIEAAYHRAGD